MKFQVGDQVKITTGKDKGKTGTITRVIPGKNQVVVAGINLYAKHTRPMAGRPGEKVVLERPLEAAKIAILNDQSQLDRIGYSVDKKGNKTRIFKKTGKVIPEPKKPTEEKSKK